MDFFDFIKSNKFIILIISVIFNILLLITSGILLWQYINFECICDDKNTKEIACENIENENFYVEIKGAVKNPGVYEANSKNIINDIITMAGGLTKDAYTDNINLSRKVSSELVIYVYTSKDFRKSNTIKTNTIVNTVYVQEKCECPTYDITACTEDKKSEIVVSKDKNTSQENIESSNSNVENNSSSDKNNTSSSSNSSNSNTNNESKPKLININTATKEELMTLSGIGEAKAKKIIEYRNTNDKFKSIDEIKKVSGIGDAMFEKIKNSITV